VIAGPAGTDGVAVRERERILNGVLWRGFDLFYLAGSWDDGFSGPLSLIFSIAFRITESASRQFWSGERPCTSRQQEWIQSCTTSQGGKTRRKQKSRYLLLASDCSFELEYLPHECRASSLPLRPLHHS
jgi:hypothetical protein